MSITFSIDLWQLVPLGFQLYSHFIVFPADCICYEIRSVELRLHDWIGNWMYFAAQSDIVQSLLWLQLAVLGSIQNVMEPSIMWDHSSNKHEVFSSTDIRIHTTKCVLIWYTNRGIDWNHIFHIASQLQRLSQARQIALIYDYLCLQCCAQLKCWQLVSSQAVNTKSRSTKLGIYWYHMICCCQTGDNCNYLRATSCCTNRRT